MPEARPSSSERTHSETGPGHSDSKGRRNRTRLWKALAGMAAALALAGAIVSMEISSHLVHRTHRYSYRIVELKKTIRELRHQAAMDRKHLLAVREELSARERVVRVLVAPNSTTVNFVPVARGEKARAELIVSRKARGAVLNVMGLQKLRAGQSYQAWWVPETGREVKVATFLPSADGSATVYLTLPARGMHARECVVALGSSGRETPGRAILKAQLSR